MQHLLQRLIGRVEEALIAGLMAAMAVLTFVQVVLRYVFNSGFVWAMEATLYMFGWMVLLGIGYGVREGAHIGVDVWVKKLPPRGRRLAGLLGAVACIGYAVLMLIGSVSYLRVMYTLGVEAEDLPIQRWVLLLALPFGFGLLLWRLLEVTWRIWSGQQASLLGDEVAQLIDEQRGADASTGVDRP